MMWVAISRPRGDGTRLMSIVGFEGAIVEFPDDTIAWVDQIDGCLCVQRRGSIFDRYNGNQLLEVARRDGSIKLIAVHD